MLYSLAKGIAPIHARGEYHGDIHDANIMIRRQGIGFELKLLDFFDLGRPSRSKIQKDVLNLVEVFHTIVGGRKHYATQPPVVKDIIRGLKDSLILERFRERGGYPAPPGESDLVTPSEISAGRRRLSHRRA